MVRVTNDLIRIDESAKIDDSEDRHCWKDLVEAVKYKACKEKHKILTRYLIFTHLSTFFFSIMRLNHRWRGDNKQESKCIL